MTHAIEKTVYSFSDLSDDAKETARNWWKDQSSTDADYADCVIEDAARVADILGITFGTRAVTLGSGGLRHEPKIFWTGFASQNNGACFEGSYAYKAGSKRAIREYAPADHYLHTLADDLQAAQRKHFYQLSATCEQRGRGTHSSGMSVSVEDQRGTWFEVSEDTEGSLADALKAFAEWLYAELESAYEHSISDDEVASNIITNEYSFQEEGTFFE